MVEKRIGSEVEVGGSRRRRGLIDNLEDLCVRVAHATQPQDWQQITGRLEVAKTTAEQLGFEAARELRGDRLSRGSRS